MKVTVVGGGLVGMAVAWRLAQRGVSVVVVDETRAGAASRVGAGLLIPAGGRVSRHQLALKSRSADLYPGFVEELEEATGLDCQFRPVDTLTVALEPGAQNALTGMSGCLRGLGIEHRTLDREQCLALEPGLGSQVGCGYLTADHSVNPEALLRALTEACTRCSVEFLSSGASAVSRTSVSLSDGGVVESDRVVVAAGAWIEELLELPLYPVKGEVVLLEMPRPLIHHHLCVQRESLYLVPRGEKTLVVGASEEEVGFDLAAVSEQTLVKRADRLVPGVGQLKVLESRVGFRPKVGDGLPLLGECNDVVVAGGHYRNGILLTPVTAELITHFLLEGEVSKLMQPFLPDRDLRDRRSWERK